MSFCLKLEPKEGYPGRIYPKEFPEKGKPKPKHKTAIGHLVPLAEEAFVDARLRPMTDKQFGKLTPEAKSRFREKLAKNIQKGYTPRLDDLAYEREAVAMRYTQKELDHMNKEQIWHNQMHKLYGRPPTYKSPPNEKKKKILKVPKFLKKKKKKKPKTYGTPIPGPRQYTFEPSTLRREGRRAQMSQNFLPVEEDPEILLEEEEDD